MNPNPLFVFVLIVPTVDAMRTPLSGALVYAPPDLPVSHDSPVSRSLRPVLQTSYLVCAEERRFTPGWPCLPGSRPSKQLVNAGPEGSAGMGKS
jgi:hypothetical protein